MRDDAALDTWIRDAFDHPSTGQLLRGMFSGSPFLANCALVEVPFLKDVLTKGPDSAFVRVVDGLKDSATWEADESELMRTLRVARRRVALLVALADLAGHWPLERVTQALSDFIDAALSVTISHLMLDGVEKGDFTLPDRDFPEDDCGYVVLAMGKHGARELNYSSDIDPILLYDPMKMNYQGERGLQQTLVRLTLRFVKILQERTADGYVCRVDLRLRPDPSSTPVVISCATAQTYYATRGENWERAAMIKARPSAGDIALGRRFLAELDGFMWREQMDFWTASEVEAIKRRINAHKGGGEVAFLGHNIKIGHGGIREVEFFTQTHQLIFAGRDAYLRCPRTVELTILLSQRRCQHVLMLSLLFDFLFIDLIKLRFD